MAELETELANALEARLALLAGAAGSCLFIASSPVVSGDVKHPGAELSALSSVRDDIDMAEALTAAYLVRCGVSWDAMAAYLNVSRQALHRRLARRAEATYAQAQRSAAIYREAAEENLATTRWLASRSHVRRDTPRIAAERLVTLRATPRWWE